MNKRDLAKAVAVQSDVDLRTVSSVLDGFTDVVTAVVARGEPVAISGFAKFVKVDRAARIGRNPATGEQIRIKASKRARITPVKAFKEAVMSPSGAPKLVRGAWPTAPDALRQAGAAAKPAPAKKAASPTATKKAGGARKTTARKTTARKVAAKRAPARTAAGRTTTARKTTARKTTAARKTTTVRKTAAKRAPARGTRKSTARR